MAAQRDLEILTLENQGKQARLGRDPNARVREQLAGVQASLDQLDGQLLGPDGGSYPGPGDAGGAGGPVVSLRQPAYAGADLPQTRAADGRRAARQPVQARDPAPAGGGYFDVYQYLKALEALPRHFYWKGFDYRVVEHPKGGGGDGDHTLSTSKEFIRG